MRGGRVSVALRVLCCAASLLLIPGALAVGCGDDFPELMMARDSGSDGSTEDSSTEDSSTEDSSTEDSGAEDSSTEDSSTEDSSTEDSGSEDSSTEDSSTEDSSTEDGGAEDSSTEDASTEDGGPADASPDGSTPDAEPDAMASMCGQLGKMCEDRTECDSGETCFGNVCLPMGQPICGGFAGTLCDAGSGFPTCYFPVGSSGGTCLDGTQLDCVCDEAAGGMSATCS